MSKMLIKEIRKQENEINELKKENQRLNNVLNELEEWFEYKKEQMETFNLDKRKETGAFWYSTMADIENNLIKLKELKESDK